MSAETMNFILGWLAGLLPSLITVYIGYRFQLKNDERKRKSEVISRRLDQMELVIDSYLDTIREIGTFVDTVIDDITAEELFKIVDMDKVRNLDHRSNVFLVVNDLELYSLAIEINELLHSQAELLTNLQNIDTLENLSIERIKRTQKEIRTAMSACNANLKKRIDFIRASDPIHYYSK